MTDFMSTKISTAWSPGK